MRILTCVLTRKLQENGDASDPQNGGKPGEGSRPAEKRKLRHKQGPMFPDGRLLSCFCATCSLIFASVVTKKIITEEEARELFQM